MRAGEAARAMATCAASQIDRHAGVHYVSVAVVIVFSRAPSIPSLLRGSVARPVGPSVRPLGPPPHRAHRRRTRKFAAVNGGGGKRRDVVSFRISVRGALRCAGLYFEPSFRQDRVTTAERPATGHDGGGGAYLPCWSGRPAGRRWRGRGQASRQAGGRQAHANPHFPLPRKVPLG